jgi:hypothetical protein
MSLGSAIVKAFLSEHPFYFVTEGKIKSVNKILKTCEIGLTNNKDKVYKDVRWISPVIPKKNTKCLLLFRDNLETRPVAFFSELDEIKTTLGEFTDIEISDLQGVNLRHKNTEIKIGTTGNLTISNGSLEIQMNVLTQKFVIKGKVEIDGDTKITGTLHVTDNITSDKEVTANNATVKTTLSQHTHPTAALGAPSSPTPGT